MSIKDLFINNVNNGDKVEIETSKKLFTGVVVSIEDGVVCVNKEDGKIIGIALENIVSYEILETTTDVSKDNNSQLLENSEEENFSDNNLSGNDEIISSDLSKNIDKNEVEVTCLCKETEQAQAQSQKHKDNESDPTFCHQNIAKCVDQAIEKIELTGEFFFRNGNKPTFKDYNSVARSTDDINLKNKMLGIAQSFENAIKSANQRSLEDYNIDKSIRKIKNLIEDEKYQSYYQPCNLLGAAYFALDEYEKSLEAYDDGDDDESAFYVADCYDSEDDKVYFACFHIYYNQTPNSHIYKYLLTKMISNQDYSLFSILDLKRANSTLYKAYNSTMRVILEHHKVSYDSKLNNNYSSSAFNALLSLIKRNNLSKCSDLLSICSDFKNCISDEYPSEDQQIKISSEKSEWFEEDNRELAECPIYAIATKAMQEKDTNKAREYYLKAIQANQKIGKSTASLLQIYLKESNFKQCVNLLGEYGYKYIREEAYNNLKAQLCQKWPNLKKQIEARLQKYENSATMGLGSFFLAQKAEYEEKDLNKAIKLYKSAIAKNDRMAPSIKFLFAIYSKLEMYDEALKLLNEYGSDNLDKNTLYTLKLSVLKKTKDHSFTGEIISTFNDLISIQPSPDKKNKMMLEEAEALIEFEEYKNGIRVYKDCLEDCKDYYFSSNQKFNKYKVKINQAICSVYLKIGKIEEAKKYANSILLLDQKNEYANSILEGNNSEPLEEISNYIPSDKDLVYNYLEKVINDTSLESQIGKKYNLEDGIYTGDISDAESMLKGIFKQLYRNYNEDAAGKELIAGAKLTKQLLDRSDYKSNNTFISDTQYLRFISRASLHFANARLYDESALENVDVARFLLLQPIIIAHQSSSIDSDIQISVFRYIQSYFSSIKEILYEGKSIYSKFSNKSSESDYLFALKELMSKEITEITSFIVGMIEFLRYYSKNREIILSYIKSNELFGKILDVISSIIGEDISDEISDEEFSKVWNKLTSAYTKKRKDFIELLQDTATNLFVVSKLQENIELLKKSEFVVLLNKTDKSNFDSLIKIFSLIIRYNEISEFDTKSSFLKDAEGARVRLEQATFDYPTFISYEKLKVILEIIQSRIFKESSDIYKNSEPKLNAEIVPESVSIDERRHIVKVAISITNAINCQNADNAQLIISSDDPCICVIQDTQLKRDLYLGDGRAKEELISFRINDKVLNEGQFQITTEIKYTYNLSLKETAEDVKKFVQVIHLNSKEEFIEIDNPFEPLKNGNEVKEASMFYGREEDIRNIIQQICDKDGMVKQGRSLALFGQTRTGKSSILYHLANKLRTINPEGNIIVSTGSIGEAQLKNEDITEFLYLILDALNEEINKNHPALKNLLDEQGINLEPDQLIEQESNSQFCFNIVFKKLCNLLKELNSKDIAPKYSIILMVDEFTYLYDWIRQGTLTERIMKFWKGLIQNTGIFAIVVGKDHMQRFIEDERFTNDFGSTDIKKSTYLKEDDAKKLMYEPVLYKNSYGEKVNRYRKGALDRLYELTSGSAYLIMNICAGLVDYLNKNKSTYITVAHIDDFLREYLDVLPETFFDPQYNDMTDGESVEICRKNKDILKRIAQYTNKKEWAILHNCVIRNGHESEDNKLIDALERRDVLIVERKNNRCKIKVVLYKEWLINKYGVEIKDE